MEDGKYRGHLVTEKCGYYWALGTKFNTLNKAFKAIDLFEAEDTEATEVYNEYQIPQYDQHTFERGYIIAKAKLTKQ